MSEAAGRREAAAAGPAGDAAPTLEALRARGADRFDPVRFHYLEVLARRAAAQTGAVRALLERRLAGAVAAYAQVHAHALAEAAPGLAALALSHPPAADEIRRLQAAGDLRAARRLTARLAGQGQPDALGDLLQQLDRANPAPPLHRIAEAGAAPAGAPAELKSLRQFRRTWSRLSVERQLSRSLSRLPDKPGPLNSQLLMLRALQRLQDLAPAYLDRFVAYADALLWLDQADAQAAPAGTPAREDPRLSPKRRPRRRP